LDQTQDINTDWLDSHCHLDHKVFSPDLPEVIQRAQSKGIQQFIVPGVGYHQWQEQVQLQTIYPTIYNAFGIHPWFCDLHEQDHLMDLDDMLEKAVAVGECGLDFMPDKPKESTQIHWFEAQIDLAKKHDLPLIVHCVRAAEQTMKILKSNPDAKGVIHGFAGSLQHAQQFSGLGFKIGIGTRIIHRESSKARALLAELPLEHILLETDAPDGHGKNIRNEPSGIILVADIIAKLRDIDSQTILDTCSANARELFKL